MPRSNQAIMVDISNCYNNLSPENLSCDGELSRSDIKKKEKQISSRLKSLFKEIGHVVTEEEAFKFCDENERARISF